MNRGFSFIFMTLLVLFSTCFAADRFHVFTSFGSSPTNKRPANYAKVIQKNHDIEQYLDADQLHMKKWREAGGARDPNASHFYKKNHINSSKNLRGSRQLNVVDPPAWVKESFEHPSSPIIPSKSDEETPEWFEVPIIIRAPQTGTAPPPTKRSSSSSQRRLSLLFTSPSNIDFTSFSIWDSRIFVGFAAIAMLFSVMFARWWRMKASSDTATIRYFSMLQAVKDDEIRSL